MARCLIDSLYRFWFFPLMGHYCANHDSVKNWWLTTTILSALFLRYLKKYMLRKKNGIGSLSKNILYQCYIYRKQIFILYNILTINVIFESNMVVKQRLSDKNSNTPELRKYLCREYYSWRRQIYNQNSNFLAMCQAKFY